MTEHPLLHGWPPLQRAIVVLLVAVLAGELAYVAHTALALGGAEAEALAREQAGRAVLERIALAVQGADRETLARESSAGFGLERARDLSLELEGARATLRLSVRGPGLFPETLSAVVARRN